MDVKEEEKRRRTMNDFLSTIEAIDIFRWLIQGGGIIIAVILAIIIFGIILKRLFHSHDDF